MKKLTLLFMVCSMAFMSYADGGNITYVLNDGVFNDDGWQNKEDMYQGLYASWNTFKGGGQTAWTPIADLADPVVGGIPTQAATMDLTFIADAAVIAKWQWLVDYMDAVCTVQGTTLPSTNASFLRYNLSAFFANGVRGAWPVSANYAVAGTPEAFISTWKHAFAGPATYDGTEEIILPTPYKEGESFAGWFDNVDCIGSRVISIPSGSTGDKVFYAKFGEYIPPCSEVWAMVAGITTKTAGVVTYVSGNTVYIQDTSAGLMLEFTGTPGVSIGEQITIEGTTAAIGDHMKMTSVSLVDKVSASLPAVQLITLATLETSTTSYMFEYVKFEGLRITANAGGIVTLSDGDREIKMIVDLSHAAGTKVNVKAVVSYTTEVVLVGAASDIELAKNAAADPATYAAMGDGMYTFTNNWLISQNMDNFSANRIGTDGFVRSMVAKDGKLYFPDRENLRLVVIDAETGEKLDPITFPAEVFTTNKAGETVTVGYPFNDLKVDSKGNILSSTLATSNSSRFQVWKLDEVNKTGTLLIDEVMSENYPAWAEVAMRFDYIGVYGDVDNDAYIMTHNGNTMTVYKWTITGGVAGKAEAIFIDTTEEGHSLSGLTNGNTAGQVYPIDENMFFIDLFNSIPTVIDMDGNVIDGFYNYNAEEGFEIRQGNNGVFEFELRGEYFLIISYKNSEGGVAQSSSFRLFKYKDANREIEDITPMWVFPNAGMGTAANGYRTAMPCVSVDEEAGIASIYVYICENGYGVYEFKSTVGTNKVKYVYENEYVGMSVDGRTIRFDQEVASVAVFSITGQQIASGLNTASIDVLSNGVYMVKAFTYDGKPAIQKVIVK